MSFPALELVWTPTGAGAVVNGHSWPLGTLQPVTERGLSFGLEGDVRLRHREREVCRIDCRDRKVRLWYKTKQHDCVVNGRGVAEAEVELRHRDLLMFFPPGKGPVFRLLETPLAAARSAALEAAIRGAPGDEELLHVYGDFLLDQGDPLGQRLANARARAADDDATWFDALALHYETGRLEVEWEHGLAVKAVLRDSLLVFARIEQALAHLLALPVMRFLRELTVDVSSDRATVAEGLHALGSVQLPETLKAISLGDVPGVELPRTRDLLDAVKQPVHVGYYKDAYLEVISASEKHEPPWKPGDRIAISDRMHLGETGFISALNSNLLLAGSHVIGVEGQRYVLHRLLHEHAKVNGRVVERFPLRDGDLIEIPGQVTARFKLTR